MCLGQVPSAAAAAPARASTHHRTPAPTWRPVNVNREAQPNAQAEAAAQHIAERKKKNAKKAKKQWCNCLMRQWFKLYGCSNDALKQYDRYV